MPSLTCPVRNFWKKNEVISTVEGAKNSCSRASVSGSWKDLPRGCSRVPESVTCSQCLSQKLSFEVCVRECDVLGPGYRALREA